jgi:hypothetical protein
LPTSGEWNTVSPELLEVQMIGGSPCIVYWLL